MNEVKTTKITLADLPWGTIFKIVGESQECVKISDTRFASAQGDGSATWRDFYTISHVKTHGSWSDVSTWTYEDGQWWA